MRWILVKLILWYRETWRPFKVSPCIFEVTCSEYALNAIQQHGALWGSRMALVRIWRCRPSSLKPGQENACHHANVYAPKWLQISVSDNQASYLVRVTSADPPDGDGILCGGEFIES